MVGFSQGKSTSYLASIFSLIMNSSNEKKVSFKECQSSMCIQML